MYKMVRLGSSGDIILSSDEFNRFIGEMKLPVFSREFEIGSSKYELLCTVFNGKIIRELVRITHNYKRKESLRAV